MQLAASVSPIELVSYRDFLLAPLVLVQFVPLQTLLPAGDIEAQHERGNFLELSLFFID
jgi:hypothetical protein